MTARAEYMRQYRDADPARREADRARDSERRRALEMLRERHQQEFDQILSEIRSTRPRKRPGRPVHDEPASHSQAR
jgi:hypothetical protein